MEFGGTKKINKSVDVKEPETPIKEEKKEVVMTAGDRSRYIYFDTEFTGLKKTTDLISIGLVDADGNTFYAEATDYSAKKCDEWINENVIKKLTSPKTKLKGKNWTITGKKSEIRVALLSWLKMHGMGDKVIQFVSDVGHYDMVLLIDLLVGRGKTAIDLPKGISPVLHDINQDIASTLLRTEDVSNENYVPDIAGFDISRVNIGSELMKDDIKNKGKNEEHNSLFDAKIIRAIHQYIWSL